MFFIRTMLFVAMGTLLYSLGADFTKWKYWAGMLIALCLSLVG